MEHDASQPRPFGARLSEQSSFILGIIGCCAKLQTSYNSPFRSYTATGLRTSGRASSRWLGISKSPQMLSPCRSFLHSSGVSGLSSIGLLGLFTSSIPYPRLSARFQKLMRFFNEASSVFDWSETWSLSPKMMALLEIYNILSHIGVLYLIPYYIIVVVFFCVFCFSSL